MIMKANATLGYDGAHSEKHNPTKKFQTFTVFDGQECDMIIEGIKGNLSPDPELMVKYHGMKAEENPKEAQAWLLARTQKELGWIYSKVSPLVKHANTSWGFDLAAIEQMNLLELGTSMNTEWHVDGFDPKTYRRKLSFSIMLSDPDSYRGGAQELWFGADRVEMPRLKKGEMLVWPSFILNRIAAVKRGPRHALVGWAFCKEPFT